MRVLEMEKMERRTAVGPTWAHLLGRVVLGLLEILIPLSFVAGMIYWRAPWLFWAVVRLIRGEPVVGF
jgi:hypothetical protein